MMFKKALFTAILSAVLISATPQIIGPSPGIPGLGDPCGFIWGESPCANTNLKCCYLYPDLGYCLPCCPDKFPPPAPANL